MATTAVSVTPTAKTVTAVISTTLTLTDSTTVTPIITETSTTTTVVASTVTSTTTQTLWPQQTADVYAILVRDLGQFQNVDSTKSPSECCLTCFSDPRGCSQWLYSSNYCTYSVAGSGSGTPGGLCPNGKGNGQLFVQAGSGAFGGPGQCAL